MQQRIARVPTKAFLPMEIGQWGAKASKKCFFMVNLRQKAGKGRLIDQNFWYLNASGNKQLEVNNCQPQG
jgi:hypothetical protein